MKTDVVDWLRAYFAAHGKSPAEDIKQAAAEDGYTRFELKEARLICQVKSESVTVWSLPEDRA